MLEVAAPGPQHHLEMIEGLTTCAYELGKAAHSIAMRTPHHDAKGFLAAGAEFRHCFFSVRMGIRLASQLRAGQSFTALRAQPVPETERPDDAERPERERPEPRESLDRERDRESDYEPISLPQFLKTLGLAAAAAERRRDELPAHIRETTLPTLKGLLAEARADAAPDAKPSATLVLPRPPVPRQAGGKSRLLTSAFTPQLRPRDSS